MTIGKCTYQHDKISIILRYVEKNNSYFVILNLNLRSIYLKYVACAKTITLDWMKIEYCRIISSFISNIISSEYILFLKHALWWTYSSWEKNEFTLSSILYLKFHRQKSKHNNEYTYTTFKDIL